MKIGPYEYAIVLSQEAVQREGDDRGDSLIAYTDLTTQTIYIDHTLEGMRRNVIFWHEFIHAALDAAGYHILGEAEEERLCTALAPIFAGAFPTSWHEA
jgi:hypothetical protein